MNPITRCLPLLGALFLAACGGGGGATTQSLASGSPGIAVGEPAPGAPAKDEFIKMARAEGTCSDRANRLYAVDDQQAAGPRAALPQIFEIDPVAGIPCDRAARDSARARRRQR